MKIPKLNAGDLLRVCWLDAFIPNAGWSQELEVDVEFEVVSVGFFLEMGKRYLIISGDVGEDRVARPIYIPVGTITKVTKMKEPHTKR